MRSFIANILIALVLGACSQRQASNSFDDCPQAYTPQYATTFRLHQMPEGIALETLSPWQGATQSTTLLISDSVDASDVDWPVLTYVPERIACLSSSHVAMLNALGMSDRVVAVSGIDYITSPAIQQRRHEIMDIGYEGNFDYERLAAARPDFVMLYGVTGPSQLEDKLKELEIPYAYIGDYLDESPLGKAEWLVPVAYIMGVPDQGVDAFAPIPQRYNHLKQLVADSHDSIPTVMVNTPYADSWVMPSSMSYQARLIDDAGAKLVYANDKDNSSEPIDMERAFLLASQADYWLNVGMYTTLDELRQAVPKFAATPPFVNGRVWNSTLRYTPGGANDYWESGILHPDLVLQDLIMIFHPQLLPDSLEFNYYENLQ